MRHPLRARKPDDDGAGETSCPQFGPLTDLQ